MANAYSQTAGVSFREYHASRILARLKMQDIPNWFLPGVSAGMPTPPAFPGTLTAGEQTDVQKWAGQAGIKDLTNPVVPTDLGIMPIDLSAFSANAQTKINAFLSYFNQDNYKAWLHGDRGNKMALWAWFLADCLGNTKSTVAVSADPSGVGSGRPDVSGGTGHYSQ